MPKGVYRRRQRKPQSAVKKKAPKKTTKAARAQRIGQMIEGLGLEESEFISHGSTHSRERAKDYATVRQSAVTMATFVAKMCLMNQNVPDAVRVAAASVLTRE